jgi:hypothetical protein
MFLFPEKHEKQGQFLNKKFGMFLKATSKRLQKCIPQDFLMPLIRPGGIFMQFQQSRAYDAVNLQVFHE